MTSAPTGLADRLGTEEANTGANTPDTLGDDPPAFVATPTTQDVEDIVTYIREASAPAADAVASEADLDATASFWDPDAMAPLSAQSAAAVARLRAYRPPAFPIWDRLPASRRAAVLLLLYADRRGDLRVVITMRAASLRNYSGHAAFPGGKADDVHETPFQIARREAWEEIGLPDTDARLPRPFRIEHLCELPHNIAATEIVVRPCVAFLHVDAGKSTSSTTNGASASGTTDKTHANEDGQPTVEESLMPRLDAKEVAAVFSAPFHNFLRERDEDRNRGSAPLPPGHWYDGRWHHFRDRHRWRVHNFHVPVDRQRVQKPKPEAHPAPAADEVPNAPPAAVAPEASQQSSVAEKLDDDADKIARYKVWGMTAHVLVDAARLAYDEVPEMEHNPHMGDEEIIVEMDDEGRFFDKKRKAENSDPAEDSKTAKKATEPAKM